MSRDEGGSMKPLIDRMAEALKPFAQVAAVYEGTKAGDSVYPMLNVSRLRDAVSVLAEYRNQRPGITAAPETARELTAVEAQHTPQTDALDAELHAPGLLTDRYADMLDHARALERKLAKVTAQRDELLERIEALGQRGTPLTLHQWSQDAIAAIARAEKKAEGKEAQS